MPKHRTPKHEPPIVHVSTRPLWNVDKLLKKEVGCAGLWQWLSALLIMLSNPPTPTFSVFSNSVPNHRCLINSTLESQMREYNLTFPQQAALIGPSSTFSETRSCSRFRLNWTSDLLDERIERILRLNTSDDWNLPNTSIESCLDGYAYHLHPNQYQSSVVIDFASVCQNEWFVPLGTSLFMLGMMFGFIGGGRCGDRFGRKRTALWLSGLELIAALTTSLAPNYTVYVCARAVVGAANLGKFTVLNVLMMECTVAKYRVFFHAIISLGYNFILRGLMSFEAFQIPNWRWLNAAVMGPTLVCFLHPFWLVESPRWLISQNRHLEALEALQFGRKINRLTNPKSTDTEPGELERLKAELCSNPHEKIPKQSNNHSLRSIVKSLCVSLTTPSLARNTLLGILLFSGEAMAYFGMLLYARQTKGSVYMVTFINAAATIPGLIISSLIYRLAKSRRVPLLCIYGSCFFVLITGGLYTFLQPHGNDLVLIICANISLVLLGAALSMLYVYIPELFPSSVRSQSFGLVAGLGRIGSILCTFVNEMDTHVGHGSPLLVYAGVMVVQMCTLAFIADTSGENLPDTLEQSREVVRGSMRVEDEVKETIHEEEVEEFEVIQLADRVSND